MSSSHNNHRALSRSGEKLPRLLTDRRLATTFAAVDIGRQVGCGPLADAADALGSGSDAPPGVCLALSTPSGRVWATTGFAQVFDDEARLRDPAPMTIDTRTDLGSVTKILATTAALMALVDAGELDLDRRIDAILPWARHRAVAEATIADLLAHRAGLWEWWPLYLASSDGDGAIDAVTRLPLRYPRGQARHYSDLGFVLLGAIAARIGNAELAPLVDALVLGPLGLEATSYARPRAGAAVAASARGDDIERRMVASGEPYPVVVDAAGFDRWRDHVLVGEVNDGNAFHAFGGVAGHAGLFSTTADLLRFGDGLLSSLDGGIWVRPETVRRFFQPGADVSQALGLRLWMSDVDGCQITAIGHTGFPGVAMAVLPDHGATVALVTNRLHVTGTPHSTEVMFRDALGAVHRQLHL
jgi:CubicO group peptidase (beta-lactamase class C family)